MNIMLAVAILTGLFMVRYPKIPSTPSPVIGYVVPDSAAAKAGVQEGDRIVQIGDTVDPTWEDIAMKEVASAGHPLSVWVDRNGERKHLTVTPVLDPRTGVGFAGWDEQNEIEIASALPDKPPPRRAFEGGRHHRKRGWPAGPLHAQDSRHRQQHRREARSELVYSRDGQDWHCDRYAGLDGHGRQPEVDDRRQPAAARWSSSACRSRRHRGIGPAKHQERDVDLSISAWNRGAPHVAPVAGRSHPHRAAIGRSRARRPDCLLQA